MFGTAALRNVTGRNNGDGTVTIWAITSTVSANGDQGADPHKLVAVNDILDNTDPAIAPPRALHDTCHRRLCRGAARRVLHPRHVGAPPSEVRVSPDGTVVQERHREKLPSAGVS
jgi:hypothetical protein